MLHRLTTCSAVKFIRDQADALITHCVDENFEKSKSPVNAAQFAASALRRILTRERGSTSLAAQTDLALVPLDVDPLDGWDEGIVLRKSHFCLLLKPQIVLRTKEHREDLQCISTVVLAALQAKLQSFRIMDVSNLEDPVSGNIMTRYACKLKQGYPLTVSFAETIYHWMGSRRFARRIQIHMQVETVLYLWRFL